MATQKKIIGKLPVFRGKYNKDVVYYKHNIVTYLGSSFISTKDENMSAPCTVGDKEFILSSGWEFFSDSSEAYFMDERFDEMAEVTVTTDDESEVNDVEPDVVNEALRKTPQTLSKAEQAQARTNIGAASLEENEAFKAEVEEQVVSIDAKVSDIGSKLTSSSLLDGEKSIDVQMIDGGYYDGTTLVNNETSQYCEKIDISNYNVKTVVVAIRMVDTSSSGRGILITDSNDNIIDVKREDSPYLLKNGIAYYVLYAVDNKAHYLRVSCRKTSTFISCFVNEKLGIEDIDLLKKTLNSLSVSIDKLNSKTTELELEVTSNSIANKKTDINLPLINGGYWSGNTIVEEANSVYTDKIDISSLDVNAVVIAINAVDVMNSGRGIYLSDADDITIFGIREDQPTLVKNGIAYYLLDVGGKKAYYLRFSSRERNTLVFCHAYKGNVENDIIDLKDEVVSLKEDVVGIDSIINGTFEILPSIQGDYEPLTGNINTSTERMRYLITDKKGIITMGEEFTFAPYGNNTGSGACTLLTGGYVTEYNSNLSQYTYTILRIKRKDDATPLLQADVKISYGEGLVGQVEAEVACYVDAEIGNDNNDGKKDSPLKTINAALLKGKKKIMIAANTYNERIYLKNVNDISICCYTPTFVLGENKDRAIINAGGNGNAVWIENCANIVLEGIEAYNSHNHCVFIDKSSNVIVRSCVAHKNIAVDNASGFKTKDSFVQFFDCEAYDVKLDGFGLSGYGTQDLYNCKAHDCADDGVSHHDACKGVVFGGEFYNCGKGGVSSPCHGSSVDVQGVYSHNNKYGLYALSETTRGKGILSNNCFINNSAYDIIVGGSIGVDLVMFNTIYETKYLASEDMITEIPQNRSANG